ncbi:hypothetical protein PR048_014327 [Dryococelus australis]|uniref:Uncharacterized protein n=1 Tax=Dryococelus australis TaxID=614101 RepID=A0ABQ9HEA8_9NEOP|nr:hypothetical protein PR048_014327 [Dryococelus australis]
MRSFHNEYRTPNVLHDNRSTGSFPGGLDDKVFLAAMVGSGGGGGGGWRSVGVISAVTRWCPLCNHRRPAGDGVEGWREGEGCAGGRVGVVFQRPRSPSTRMPCGPIDASEGAARFPLHPGNDCPSG